MNRPVKTLWKSVFLSALMILATALPMATVFASHTPADTAPDGFVAVITPRLATAVEGGVLIQSSGNMYVLDFELFDAQGNPFFVTKYSVDVHTIDGRADPNQGGAAGLVVEQHITSATPISKGVIRIPASDIVYHTQFDNEMPFGGFAIVMLANYGATGNRLYVGNTLHYPSAAFSVAANQAAAQGRWGDADQLGEGWTPAFLLNGQYTGMYEFTNPLLNPGFEVGGTGQGVDTGPCDCDFSSSTPPWVLIREDGAMPASTTHFIGAAGKSGSAVNIRLAASELGQRLAFGQLLHVPTSGVGGFWVGSENTKVEFDVRVRDPTGKLPAAGWKYHASSTLHWLEADGSESQFTFNQPAAKTVPANNAWHHVTADFGNKANGLPLASFFLSLYLDNWATTPPGAQFQVYFDNVRITGANYVFDVNPKNDQTDGYAGFILPAGQTLATGQNAVQRLTTLGSGATGYVYTVGVEDFTGVDPKRVDLATNTPSMFQLLDEQFITSAGSHDPSKTVFSASSTGVNAPFFRYLGADGTVSENVLVVVPASHSGKTIVPWFWKDVPTEPAYTDTFGANAKPSSAFYSAVRNQFMGQAFADHLDHAATPLTLSSIVGHSMRHGATLGIVCPGMTSTVTCASADPTPDLQISYTTTSNVFETVAIELVAAFDGSVIGTGTVTTPNGGTTVISIPAGTMSAMDAAGDSRVFARTAGTVFADGKVTGLFELKNFAPTAAFTSSDLTNLFKGSAVTFTDASTDNDGSIARLAWSLNFLSDDTPDGDADSPHLVRALVGGVSTNDLPRTFRANVADDGNYEVKLTAFDDDLATDEATLAFVVKNAVPTAVFTGPTLRAQNGIGLYNYAVNDREGNDLIVEFDDGSGVFSAAPASPISVTFATAGTHTLRLRVDDGENGVTTVSLDVVVDGDAPVTTLTVLNTPDGQNGWYKTAPRFSVDRTDATSGVQFTVVEYGVTQTVNGTDSFERAVSKHGLTTITAVSTDNAGNVGNLETASVKYDPTPATVTMSNPSFLGPLSGIYRVGETVTASALAVDDGAEVVQVEFFVEGVGSIGLGTKVGDTWSADWIASGLGTHDITAVAMNAAGLVSAAKPIKILVA